MVVLPRVNMLRNQKNAMLELKQRLNEKGMTLPQAPTPVGAYSATIQSGNYLYVSGQFPFKDGKLQYKGQLGKDLSTHEGYLAAELCALNLLSQIDANMKDNKLNQIVKLDGYINSSEWFEGHAKVLDGATNLLASVLDNKAGHARSVMGCTSLPYCAAVEITAVIELEKKITTQKLNNKTD